MFKRALIALVLMLGLVTSTYAQQGVLKNATIAATGADAAVYQNLSGIEGVSVTVTNSGTYTLQFEGFNGVAWVAFPGIQLSDFTRDTSTTGPDTWFFGNLGYQSIRVRASAYTSGVPRVTIIRGFGGVIAPYSAGSVSGANDAASATGSGVPSSAGYTGLNVGGTLRGWTGISLGSHFAGTMAIVDGSGNQITSFGGGTQYTNDAALTVGSTVGTMALGRASAAAPTNVSADNDVALPWYLRNGAQATVVTAAGALVGGDATNGLDVDVTRVIPGVTATALGKAEDAAHASGDTGVLSLAVRNDAGSALAGTDADYIPLTTDNTGALRVTGGGGGTQYTQDAALTVGSTVGTMAMGRASAAAPTDVSADSDAVLPWYLRSGAQAVQPTYAGVLSVAGNGASGTGVQRVTIANDSTGVLATVSNVATIGTSVTPGTSAAHLGKAEDAVAGSGDTGVAILGVAQATVSATAADGDYIHLKTDANGRMWVNCAAGCSGGTQFAEDAPHTTGDVGTVTMGVRRDTPTSLAGADNDYMPFTFDSTGRGWVNIFGVTQAAATYLTVRLSDGTNFLNPASDVTEDAAETAGGTGPMVMTVRRDTLASSSGTSGDNSTLNTNSIGALYTQPTAGASGGATSFRRTSAGSTEDEHEVKGSAGTLYSVTLTNTNAAVRYFRCADQVAASTTPGTTTPIIDLAIPGATTGAGITFPFPVGMTFGTGLTCWFVTGAADTDVAEVAANEIKALYTYK